VWEGGLRVKKVGFRDDNHHHAERKWRPGRGPYRCSRNRVVHEDPLEDGFLTRNHDLRTKEGRWRGGTYGREAILSTLGKIREYFYIKKFEDGYR